MKVKETESSQRGAAMVEAALTMLTLLVLLFAIFEAGRLLNIQQTLTNAAREGARLSVLPLQGGTDTLPTEAQVRSRVRIFLDAVGLNDAVVPDDHIEVCLWCDPPGECNAFPTPLHPCALGSIEYARVTVRAPYRVLTISMFSFLEVDLRGQATMRNETNFK